MFYLDAGPFRYLSETKVRILDEFPIFSSKRSEQKMSVDFYAKSDKVVGVTSEGTEYNPYLMLETEINMSNVNAKLFLDFLGLKCDDDDYGCLTGEVTLVEANRAWMATNARFDKLVEKFIRPSTVEERVHEMDLDKEYFRNRLNQFREFIIEAFDFGATHIYWC